MRHITCEGDAMKQIEQQEAASYEATTLAEAVGAMLDVCPGDKDGLMRAQEALRPYRALLARVPKMDEIVRALAEPPHPRGCMCGQCPFEGMSQGWRDDHAKALARALLREIEKETP